MNRVFNRQLFRYDATLLLLSVILFLTWPEIDLIMQGWFYDSETQSFPANNLSIIKFFYYVFLKIHIPVLLILIFGMIYFSFKNQFTLRRKYAYLFCCLILGPGILVNLVLKDNSTGRPRPRDVVQFGGEHEFKTPFEYAGVCEKNCSFVCGHASIGFALLAMAWVTGIRLFFIAGATLGFLIGLMRMAQGGHFFSDVIFSFWVVYGACMALTYVFKLRMAEQESPIKTKLAGFESKLRTQLSGILKKDKSISDKD